MCGIAGVITKEQKKNREELLRRMCKVLHHRGPDDDGLYISKKSGASLCQTRLSIIDLVSGHQPLCGEDGKVWIVFNGEIYNFQELRNNLIKSGHTFKTSSDTETIVHLYEEKGTDCVNYLRGMFAFAIWDEPNQTLFLARDRLGKKPLSYYWNGEKFIFASEIKAILEDEGVPRKVNHEALEYYLTFLYTPPPISMFDGIKKLPPAHWLLLKDGKVKIQRYWQPILKATQASFETRCENIRTLLTEAVKLRLISDVPLGAFLSGGIDSSIVVGLMTKLSKERVKTFSIGFEEKEFSEINYARIVAKHFNTDHHEFFVKPDALEILPKLIWHYDEPFGDSSAIPTYYVSKMTSQFVKVALSGDGGDELFAGYKRYEVIKYLSRIKKIPPVLLRGIASSSDLLEPIKLGRVVERIKKLLRVLERPLSDLYITMMSYFDGYYKNKVLIGYDRNDTHCERLIGEMFDEIGGNDPVSAAEYADIMTYLPYDILVKVDIASMANSLEVRCPLLDHKVAEYAMTIPSELKLNRISKEILKRAFADLLPREILERGKMGFGVPLRIWFRNDLNAFLRETILSKRASERGYFRIAEVEKLLTEHSKGVANHADRLWLLLNFELWHQTFIDGKISS